MRILITLAYFAALVLAVPVAGAADYPQQSSQSSSLETHSYSAGSPGVTALQLSPIHGEIQQVLDRAAEKEQALLKELAAATKDEEVERIIRRIERLEMDRTVAILKIQARYARLEGRWNLDFRLRARIMEIQEHENYAAH